MKVLANKKFCAAETWISFDLLTWEKPLTICHPAVTYKVRTQAVPVWYHVLTFTQLLIFLSLKHVTRYSFKGSVRVYMPSRIRSLPHISMFLAP